MGFSLLLLSLLALVNGQTTTAPTVAPTQAQITTCFNAHGVVPLIFQATDPVNYNLFRKGYNARSLDYYPAVIVHVSAQAHIVAAVQCASTLKMQITVKGGGKMKY